MYSNNDKKWFVENLKNKELVEKLKKISLVISDIDGCLTDGKAYYSSDTEIQKCFSIQDGYAMTKLNKTGMPYLGLISGRSDAAATKRAKKLGIPDDLYFQGVNRNKSETVRKIQEKLKITKENTLFFGDDFLDLETRDSVSIFASPSNGLFYVHSNSEIITPRAGGDGAFRLILDLLLYVQEKHFAQDFIENSIEK